MPSLPLQRSKELLEKLGYKVWIVEVWHAFAHIRRDLYNMSDLVAIRDGHVGVMGIQCCSEDVQPHIKKLLEGYYNEKKQIQIGPNEYLPLWLRTGNSFFIWAWRKRGAAGKRKTWELREIEFVLQNGQVVAVETPARG